MSNIGNEIQFGIYKQMHAPDPDRLPTRYEDWEKRAREVLEDGPYDYVAGGSGAEDTKNSNREAFKRWNIVPRVFRHVEERNLKVGLFGQMLPSPIMVAPVGVQSIIHQEGELASAKAAASMGIPYIASSASSHSMEEIADAIGDAPKWFQLYWSRDPEIAKSFVQRAEHAGYSAIVVTLDTPMMAWRELDLQNVYLPFLIGEGIGNYLTDPAFRAGLHVPPEKDAMGAIMHWTNVFGNAGLTWEDLAELKKYTSLPIILKGILHPDDAKLAIKYGADGIIVSNHGGRQVDGAIAALDALPAIVEAVENHIPVLMDSGIRRGADVFKAIALGAEAVLVGRPCMYGLAVGGENGVKQVLSNLVADFDLTMALSGCRDLTEVNKDLIIPASR
ncbi:lactate 2-monooxygenase [Alkalihalobacillus hwajinpoensis]|uniref:lactate 2-monooxygenase n=1 Tax=Guptibacillus hwajinpoensis TaxID=208199 RepID=UPI0018836E0B|nr:lactate 2-monooxygenase [Pseudalkalibacillus hwajinpoensis]MBF0708737.1 lactate 2-monooxygenase [Pseudalkalibacillus hwajinpoensis]